MRNKLKNYSVDDFLIDFDNLSLKKIINYIHFNIENDWIDFKSPDIYNEKEAIQFRKKFHGKIQAFTISKGGIIILGIKELKDIKIKDDYYN